MKKVLDRTETRQNTDQLVLSSEEKHSISKEDGSDFSVNEYYLENND